MPLPTLSARPALGPVSGSQRIELLDVLRGFALFGVLWANVLWFFSGYGGLSAEASAALVTARFDPAVLQIETFLVVNKFISIFSFLFGVGFALQLQRAVTSDTAVASIFVRRMLWLLLIGVTHALLVWYGDILHLYAVLGLVLLTWRSFSDRALLRWGLVLAAAGPTLIDAVILGVPVLTNGAIVPDRGFESRWDTASDLAAAFSDGAYFDIVRANMADVWAWLTTDDATSTGVASFGRFLLGLWVGRSGLLALVSSDNDPSGAPPFTLDGVRWAGWASLALGIVCQGLSMVKAGGDPSPLLTLAQGALWDIGVLAMAMSYVCGLTVLFRDARWRRRLRFLAPVGRAALTNYLSQSVICVGLFYGIGLGWYGQVGPTGALVVTVGVFASQCFISAWWLRRYRFGPAEWLWRSLTYGQRQKFRVRSAA